MLELRISHFMSQSKKVIAHYRQIIEEFKTNNICKVERVILSPQSAKINVEFPNNSPAKEVINFCANNYLGLSNHLALVDAARHGLEQYGYGMSSVRFICGTQDIHKELEQKVSKYLGTEDTILYSSCFDANGGMFEALLGEDDVILSDELNHASIIDGIRLCKAHRYRYKHNDIRDLESHLKQSMDRRFRMIATDGVFSMDGELAKLPDLVELAEKYDAILMVDDSHATGFIGKKGKGTHEHFDVMGKVDIITTTFGKALGGASGGCISGSKIFIDVLRQKSRPYIFSNSVSPVVVAGTIKALELLEQSTELRDKLEVNTKYFRQKIKEAGFEIIDGFHPIVPIMIHSSKLVQQMARDLYDEGVYVIGFFYPIVPKGKDRIRVQISAIHEKHHIDKAVDAFIKVGKRLGVIN
jgi:glycine C-acetyltransferase